MRNEYILRHRIAILISFAALEMVTRKKYIGR